MSKGFNLSVEERFQTFLLSPFPSDVEFGVSVMKLAEAGFVRPRNSISDEVECSSCSVKYSGWSGESPVVVHRILNPTCPFLNTPTETNNDKSHNRNELEKATKLQFPTIESSAARFFNVPEVKHPFTPKNGDYLMLFESYRLLTFKNPLSVDAAVYAEAGFMYDISLKSVFCVFCNLELDFQPTTLSQLEEIHVERYPLCPFANCFDVGNISSEDERNIKKKILIQHLQKNVSRFNEKVKYLIKHPEFEDEAARLGTFLSWPRILTSVFPAEEMASSGFYYTGFNDKVKCYSCGVGLCNWTSDAVPLEQHAKASPHCVFLLDSKGRNFVNNTENIELIVEADLEESGSESLEQEIALSVTNCASSQSPLAGKTPQESSKDCGLSHTPSGLSPVLDLGAIEAALECQYPLEQIAHAITKFFILSCGHYPNEELLIGTLKAADENYLKLCEKSQEIIHTKAELEVKKAENAVFQAEKILFQAKEAQFQAREAQFRAEKAAYQREIQDKNRELQRDLIIQRHRQDLEEKDEMLKKKDHMLEEKDKKLEQNHVELEMKTKELEDLQRHIRSLQAALESKKRSQGNDEESIILSEKSCPDLPVDEFPVASCKVCFAKRSNIMFQPCKHLCCCDNCASQLLGQNCPICRRPNLGYEKVYVI